MAGHFAAPFFYLMGRAVKRNGVTLAAGGAWLLVMHFLDLYWQVMPTLHPEGFRPSVLDVAAFLTVIVGRDQPGLSRGALADGRHRRVASRRHLDTALLVRDDLAAKPRRGRT